MNKNINRRSFLKRFSAGVATATLATSCSSSVNNDEEPKVVVKKENMEMRINSNDKQKVSLIAYGCMRWPTLADKREDPEACDIDQEQVNSLVDRAIEGGINFFDTAPTYCKGFSERSVGIALKKHERSSFLVATKLSNFNSEDWTRERTLAMYERSFKELQVDYIDYYVLHSIGRAKPDAKGNQLTFQETFEARYVNNGVIDTLMEEKKKGRIRNLGFSFHGQQDAFDYFLSLHDEGRYVWDFVYIQMNYMDWQHASKRNTQAEYMYNELAKRNIPVIVMEPLLGGRLAELPLPLSEKLQAVCPNKSIASWAFRFVGSFPNILTILSGMRFPDHLENNLETFCDFQPLNETEKNVLNECVVSYAEKDYILCTCCEYCMPCKYGVDIPSIFTHYNKCLLEDDYFLTNEYPDQRAFQRARRNFLIGYDRAVPRLRQATHCINCGECLEHCPQHINIPEKMREIDQYVESLKRTDVPTDVFVVLRKELNEKQCSLVVRDVKGENHIFNHSGVKDLYTLVTTNPKLLHRAYLADKVVGKGAAALMIIGGISGIYTRVISEPALQLFKQTNIRVEYDELVPEIINRKGDGLCPVESLVKDLPTAKDCLKPIGEFVSKLNY